MLRRLWKSKAFWTGVAAIIGAIGAYAQGMIDAPIMLQGVGGGLATIFLRDGISKLGR